MQLLCGNECRVYRISHSTMGLTDINIVLLCSYAKRSFLYLLAAKQFYDYTIQEEMNDKTREGLETTLTLNLFYLAQAYGFVGNTDLSALYCHMVRVVAPVLRKLQ